MLKEFANFLWNEYRAESLDEQTLCYKPRIVYDTWDDLISDETEVVQIWQKKIMLVDNYL